MMREPGAAYEIVHGDTVVSVGERCLIGRGPECTLRLLHDPLVSRAHVRLTVCAHGVALEDLGTRDGTVIDGVLIHGSRLLTGDHRLQVGNTELLLRLASPTPDAERVSHPDDDTAPPRTIRSEDGPPIPRALFETAAMIAMHRAHANDLERAIDIAGPHLARLLRDALRGKAVEPARVEIASEIAFVLAAGTRRVAWLEYVLKLHDACHRELPPDAASVLEHLRQALPRVERRALLSYCAELRKTRPRTESDAPSMQERLDPLGSRLVG